MANTEHNALTTSALHENKGVSAATDNTVATAVSGATVWAKLTASNLTTSGNPFGAQLFHIREEQSKGVESAMTYTSGSWIKVPLTTSITNEITSASLSSSVITLPAGTYWIEALHPVSSVIDTAGRLRLRNTTDGTTTLNGTNWSPDAASGSHNAMLVGRFTIAGAKTFELQFRAQSSTTTGYPACNFSDETTEVYSYVLIYKVL